jgi:hypothetical protein
MSCEGSATLSLRLVPKGPGDHACRCVTARSGRHHPTGTITIPEDALKATLHYICRTPTHGHLREAIVVAMHPAIV